MTARYFDSGGQPIELGAVLGRGGEATVYAVRARENQAAKLYTQPSEVKAAKLQAMLAGAAPAVTNVCAWPTTLVHNGHGAVAVGFLMPKLEQSHPLDSLIIPAQRKSDFPGVDWRFIVHVARNLADAVEEIHRHGLIVGDLNENNVRVTADGEVRFIDCDSFQVRAGSRVFRCPVATLLYWPPELQGQSADAVDRTTNHDAFALAVLIFRLLFLGRHPFAGRYTGRGEQPDIPELIRTHRFAFGSHSAERDVVPPPGALTLQQLPGPIAVLFERAFAPSASTSGSRPKPLEWVGALDVLKRDLIRCKASTAHWFPTVASSCPWCEIERTAGIALFLGLDRTAGTKASTGTLTSHVDVDALWRAIAAVPTPAPAAQLLPVPPELRTLEAKVATPRAASGLASHAKATAMVSGLCLLFAGAAPSLGSLGLLGLFASLIAYLAGRATHALALRRQAPARQAVDDALRAWATAQQEIEAARAGFSGKVEQLRGQRDQHKNLRSHYEEDLDSLRSKSRAAQTHEHLQRYPIRKVKLPGLGPTTITELESYGIHTADDVEYDRVRYVRGIGPKRADALVAWKAQCEAKFKLDAHRGVDPGALAAIRQRYLSRHEQLAGALAVGPRMLMLERQRVEQIARDRRPALEGLTAHAEALLKA